MLAPLFLASDDGSCRNVGDPDGRIGRVDVLAAGARGAVGIDLEILFVDLDLLIFVGSRRTATVIAEVWTRPCVSVSGTRWTRCVPASYCIRRKTLCPERT